MTHPILHDSAESRSDLLQYYPQVKTCSLCKKDYGYDPKPHELKKQLDNSICPVCINKMKALTRSENRLKRHRKARTEGFKEMMV